MFPRPAQAAAVAFFVLAGGHVSVSAAEDPLVATVNGYEIHLSKVKEAHDRLPQQYRQVPFETIFSGLVDSLIDVRLAATDARAVNLHKEQEFKDKMTRIEEQVLQRMALSRAIKAGVTAANLKARHEAMNKDLAGNEQIQASHILLEKEEDAQAVIQELKKGGDFADLAREKSTGPSASKGGDLGFFSQGQMVPAFEEVAFKMKKGEFTETPVKTQFGWHIIRVVDRKKIDVPSFEEMEPTLRNQLSQEAGAAYITRLRSKAKITRFKADGSSLAEAGAADKKKP